jgi:hypothetical protein
MSHLPGPKGPGLKKPHVDPAQARRRNLLSYVRSKYIGTLRCLASLKLYGKWLNRCKGLGQCCLYTNCSITLPRRPLPGKPEKRRNPQMGGNSQRVGPLAYGKGSTIISTLGRLLLPLKEEVSAVLLSRKRALG